MKLSVVIVNYNHKFFPKMAIEALEKIKRNFEMEIIVVDNNSSDEESVSFLTQANNENRITLIRSPKNVGFGQGNNMGAKIADGDYLFFHNPDLTVSEYGLQSMIDYMHSHKDIGILAPKLVYSSGKVQESCRRHMSFFDLVLNRTCLGGFPFFKKRVDKYLMEDFNHDEVQDVELVAGAAIMMPRTVFNEVGCFDKRYFLFMEDFDLSQMVRKAGYRVVYYPHAVMQHYHKRLSQGSTLKLIGKKVFWLHLSSAIKYFWKWRNSKN